MTEQQINQIIGQLEASISKFEETEAVEVEFQDYCDNIYTCISYWRNQLREVKIKNKQNEKI